MNEMWNERYKQIEYVYGEKPNEFFKEQILKLKPGKLLLPAEGEGRNAVYAAINGWEVVAFDSSEEAKKKAQKLALKNNVEIEYLTSSIEEFDYSLNSFDVISLIYAHTPNRKENHQKLIKYLKPGGILILEGFSKGQINNSSGGPKKLEMLFSEIELKDDFESLEKLEIEELESNLNEGSHHLGKASIIRLKGGKAT